MPGYNYFGRFARNINSMRAAIAKLHCPKCFSTDIFNCIMGECLCKRCYNRFEFKNLLNQIEVRNKKIEDICEIRCSED
jgi:hypothetical protein